MIRCKYFTCPITWSIILIGVFLAFEPTFLELTVQGKPLDLFIQDLFYQKESHQWIVEKKAQPWHFLHYKLPLLLLYSFAAYLIAALISNKIPRFTWMKEKKNLIYIILNLALTPSLIATLKANTDIYVPADLARYESKRNVPYVRVLEHYPQKFLTFRAEKKFGKGSSFPAGHCSGGFALLSLFFVVKRPQQKYALMLGMGAGLWMGIYKILIGDHYLSHTIITAIIAWLIACTLARALRVNHS